MAEPKSLAGSCAALCQVLLTDRVPSRALALIGAGLIAAFFHGWIVQSSGSPILLPRDIPPPRPILQSSQPDPAITDAQPDATDEPGSLMPNPDDGPEPGTLDDPSTTQGGSSTDDPTIEHPDEDPPAINRVVEPTIDPVSMDPNTFGVDLTLAQTKYLYDLMLVGESVLFVDARNNKEVYTQGHIAEAIHASAQMIDAGDPDAMMVLEMFDPAMTRVVIYCAGGDCDESLTTRTRLYNFGFETTYIFTDGYPAWREAGYPIATGDRPEGD